MKLRDRLPSRRVALLAAATAVMLLFAYPPASLVLPSFVALVPMLWALEELGERGGSGREAAWLGWWFGVFAHGLTLYWMIIALWHFTPLSALGYAASVLVVLSPQWALATWAAWRARKRTSIPMWIAFPLIWTAVEWLQGHYSDLRFPWLGLGSSLVRVPTLVQWADIAGARGVTLWMVWANVMVFLALRRRAWKPLATLAATVVAALGYGAWREATIVTRPVAVVAALQPNVGFRERSTSREDVALLNQLLRLSRAAGESPTVQLIAWPEAAVPDWMFRHPDWSDSISRLARELVTPILAGGLDVQFAEDGSGIGFNAAFLYDTAGAVVPPIYRKKYLVPIVERVPFLNPAWFGGLKWFGGFGKGDRFPVYRIREGGFGVLICYESAFEDLSRHYRRDGADFLVNITNDGWYGRTWAPAQHASHLVMRAIETRAGIARAANTGISEFVDPLGRVHEATSLNTERIVSATVVTTDVRTLYVRLGDWVAIVAIVGAIACVAASWIRTAPPGETA